MKMKTNLWVYCLLILITAGSCKKYINLAPEDATYDQVFWTTGDNVNKAVSGAYGLLRNALRDTRSHFIFGDLPTPEFTLDAGVFWNYQDLTYDKLNHYSYVPYLEGALLDWTRFYGIINQCHLIIENAAKIPDSKFTGGKEEKDQLAGEGHFLRGYTYFYITRIWGDPVLTRESLKDPLNIQPIARSKETEALDYCIEELKVAASLLSLNKGTSNDRIRADKGAAWAALAQVYAWKHDYANAKKYCDSVINDGGYSLEPADTYENIWKGNSGESIFELFMKYDQANNEATSGFYNIFLYEPIVNRTMNNAWRVNTDYAWPLFSDSLSDKRFEKIFGNRTSSNAALTKYATINYYDANRPTVYVVDNNLVLLRLADILLLRAEARYYTGDVTGAMEDVNTVRTRAGTDPVLAGDPFDIMTIYNERQKELYGEGSLAYDFIRMILTNADPLLDASLREFYTPERIAKKGYYWPLNMRVLLPQNSLLTQNEWWKNH
jgi:starch-binding outer membrane protein, SusD/RagB family